MKPTVSKDFWIGVRNAILIQMGLAIAIAVLILICMALSACQCTEKQREETQYLRQDGTIERIEVLDYISTTSWCTDTNIEQITIRPDGTVTVKQFDRKEDSIKAKALIGGVPVTVESGE